MDKDNLNKTPLPKAPLANARVKFKEILILKQKNLIIF